LSILNLIGAEDLPNISLKNILYPLGITAWLASRNLEGSALIGYFRIILTYSEVDFPPNLLDL
jgi:hypothetical protein